jgi:hypothetical protein
MCFVLFMAIILGTRSLEFEIIEVEEEVQRLATAEVLEESYVGAAAAAAVEQVVLAGPVVAAGHKEVDIM